MSIRFVLGRAGMGKTRYFIDMIKDKLISDPAGDPIILIVPEQSTFQMEQAFLEKEDNGLEGSDKDIEGFTRLHILSFERLSKKVLQMTGGDNKAHLTDTGKEMILKGLIQDRLNEGSIEFLKKAANQRGFVDKLSNLIREAKMYNISPEDFVIDRLNEEKSEENKEENTEDVLDKKLQEISFLFDDYQKHVEDSYLHQEDYYFKAYEKIDEFELLHNSEVYVDGFFGFTPRELMMLEKIMLNVSYMEISLTLDPLLLQNKNQKNITEVDLFYPVIETYNRLTQMALKNNIDILDQVELPSKDKHRFNEADELYLLEKNWDKISPREVYTDEPQNIELIQASNRRGEVEKIARKILIEVKQDSKRFKDISIIVRDFDDYEPIIKSVFSKYDIPYFIDKKEIVYYHPLVELFRSVLEIVMSDFSYESVFRYLKTDLVDVSRDEVDKLENYVLAHGIKGRQWIMDEPWGYVLDTDLENLDDKVSKKDKQTLEEIDVTRDKIVKVLKPIYESLKIGKHKQAYTAKEITLKLWELIEELNVPLKLQEWIEDNKSSKEHYEMQFNTQVWDVSVDLFDELVYYLGDKKMSVYEYLQVLEQGFENISLGLIPPSLDQVVVGSVERSRQHDIKSIYLLGLCEGSFPASFLESGIFNDRERLVLRDKGIELAPTTEKKLYDEQFWAYVTLTRAREKLVLSYPLAGQDGGTLHPSPIIDNIKRIIPSLEEEYFHEDLTEDELDILINPKNLIPIMVQQMQKMDEPSSFWKNVLSVIKEDYIDELKQNPAYLGLSYKNQVTKLPDNYIDEKYDGVLKSSVSALENYCSCPFMFLAGRMLKLKEREFYRLDPLGFGILYHAVLKLFFEKLNEEGLSWKDVSSEEIETFIDEILEKLSGRLKSKILESSERNRYVTEKLKEHLNNAISILAEHEIKDGFSPLYAELEFGEKREVPPLEIEIDGGRKLKLEGKIDRIDEAKIDGEKYVRVIDYKGQTRPIDLKELYYGINLQLPVYLLVVVKNSKHLLDIDSKSVKPGGMLYFGIKSPVITSETPLTKEEADKKFRNKMKMDGYILADEGVYNAMTGGRDDLLKQKYSTKQGRFTARSRVLDIDDFSQVLNFSEKRLAMLAGEICEGNFDISPYKMGTDTPCGYCSYNPVCQFDLRFDGNNYRRIGDKDNYLELITGELED
ncbi:helicase-exonuclease AddAB subunit AddB [Natranaerofaba carboxydovora]|uniref:helicase-exonuclease AddAB subunit AddB n=1 Tax=Natranaerofaba carboxydovora TaxID=2742683 RepID=UPI001F129A72|nr:helicase-exonuclease AddAB subunit AddB [Natranaerofaba carboxydovora]UMZ74076.1 ATP-dependent helicase/deoxyribonuclease subunit B [Natranaerofaba carboxydovora]